MTNNYQAKPVAGEAVAGAIDARGQEAADLNGPAYDTYFGQVRKYADSLPRYIIWDSKHPDYPVEWTTPGRPTREGELGFFRHDVVNELMAEAREEGQRANASTLPADPLKLGQAIAKWIGGEYTAYRTDNGEPEQWVKVSVERLGHAVAAALASREDAPASLDAETGAVAAQPVADVGYFKGEYAGLHHEAMNWVRQWERSGVSRASAILGALVKMRVLAASPSCEPAPASAPEAHHRIPGLGFITDEDEGRVTLQFKDEAAASQFMKEYGPSVDIDDMPPRAPEAPEQQGEASAYLLTRPSGFQWVLMPFDITPQTRAIFGAEGTTIEPLYRAALAQAAPATGKVGATEWRVGLFWSSANPGNQVRVLAEGESEIAEYEKRDDFLRWLATPAPTVQAETGEALRLLIAQIEKATLVDEHGHLFKNNIAFINAKGLL